MRYLLLLALAGCGPDAKPPMPDAADPFGGACVPDGTAPQSTCRATDGEVGWCVDDVCHRGCISGACPHGGDPTPVFGDCYCK
jgi:hypothetical protein